MSELLGQLGINWKLFISQAVNFLILLLVLRAFVYKPVLAILEKREKKIKEGLDKANEADIRLNEVDEIAKGKIRDVENKTIEMLNQAEQDAKALEEKLTSEAEENNRKLMVKMSESFEKQKEEAQQTIFKEATEIVKNIVTKTVGLGPESFDEKLIEKAVEQVKKDNYGAAN